MGKMEGIEQRLGRMEGRMPERGAGVSVMP